MAAIDSRGPAALPAYSNATLAALSPAELIALMVRDEDHVPRNLIDACAHRGEDMVAELRRVLDQGRPWQDNAATGEWWLSLHASMILGLIPGVGAGRLLIGYMRRMALEEDNDMQDWLAGWWPALFRNKPGSVVQALRDLCADRGLDWYVRANALEPIVAFAERADSSSRDEALAWAATFATDETEDWDWRLSAGSALLESAPGAHRPLLENLAARQSGPGAWFSIEDVRDAYSGNGREAQWRRMNDPWEFYRPGHIATRQDRWDKEDAEEKLEAALAEPQAAPAKLQASPAELKAASAATGKLPFLRETPKIGRNDPCPCGSGKKYKKCCLGSARA